MGHSLTVPRPAVTLLEELLPTTLFLPETLLLRILRKDWRRDFFRDFTRERGPSMARESLGWSVHLRHHGQLLSASQGLAAVWGAGVGSPEDWPCSQRGRLVPGLLPNRANA